MTAQLDVLAVGYVGSRVAGTVVLVRDGESVIVIDPGMVASRGMILDPLAALGFAPDAVTDVVFSHHHPDHTLNAALFPDARFHDVLAMYRDDVWTNREFDGSGLSRITPSLAILRTPGHSEEDVSTIVGTADGTVVCTHLWWHEKGPADDPYAPDRAVLRASREKVLALRPALIVPGHGAPFAPTTETPR
jgi:glyoxylase-like metal-dependent hydrolase (beta-lactamase superfamily II)